MIRWCLSCWYLSVGYVLSLLICTSWSCTFTRLWHTWWCYGYLTCCNDSKWQWHTCNIYMQTAYCVDIRHAHLFLLVPHQVTKISKKKVAWPYYHQTSFDLNLILKRALTLRVYSTVTSYQEAKFWCNWNNKSLFVFSLVWTVLPVYPFSPPSRTQALLPFSFGPGLYVISPADWNLITRNMYSNFHPVAANIRQVQLSQSHVSVVLRLVPPGLNGKYPSETFTKGKHINS